jgi:nucleotide-binding universal stress UspA family protein
MTDIGEKKRWAMTKVLVATDGSEGGNRAVDYAARLAKREGFDLLIVNIVGGLPDKLFSAFTDAQQQWFNDLLESLSAELLSKARDRARKIGVGTIELESRGGEIAPAIIEIAQRKAADVIVVGKHGAGLVESLLIGNVAHKLASLAPLPVIIVP